MSSSKRTVLITGCSDGGLGAALAVAFHNTGLHVYATARDTSKMKSLESLGIDTIQLDVQSESSITACVSQLSKLDMLVNNAGSNYVMPVADVSIPEAKKIFDLNLWSQIAVTQAFLPLLLKSSQAVIANQTSVSASCTIPYGAVYHSSKAALAMFTDTLRLELQAFGVSVVDLRTGAVKSGGIQKYVEAYKPTLPKGSIYEPARERVEKSLKLSGFQDSAMPQDKWADQVVRDLLRKSPPAVIWRGESAQLARIGTFFPHGTMDGFAKKMVGLDEVERIIRK